MDKIFELFLAAIGVAAILVVAWWKYSIGAEFLGAALTTKEFIVCTGVVLLIAAPAIALSVRLSRGDVNI